MLNTNLLSDLGTDRLYGYIIKRLNVSFNHSREFLLCVMPVSVVLWRVAIEIFRFSFFEKLNQGSS